MTDHPTLPTRPTLRILTPLAHTPMLNETFVWDELMQWHGDKPACPGGRCRPQKEAPDAHAD